MHHQKKNSYDNHKYDSNFKTQSKTIYYYLKWSFIISIIISLISFCVVYDVGNSTVNSIINGYINYWIYPFLIIPIIITIIAYMSRCHHCKSCFSKSLIDDSCIDSYKTYKTVNTEKEVGNVVRRYHYKDGGSRVTHTDQIFENKTYTIPTTHFKHKQTYKCNICGNIEIKYYETTK